MRLHLGSGKRHLPGWHHRDISSYEHIDSVGPISSLSEFSSGSVEEIYCSHALEYLDPQEASLALKEWSRVLVPGGMVRVAVPDFDSLCRIYAQTGKIDSILGPLFGRMGSDEGLIFHKTVYTLESLSRLLRSSGFSNIETYDPVVFIENFDEGYDDHSLAFFPHMDRSGIQVSLCLTAVKSDSVGVS